MWLASLTLDRKVLLVSLCSATLACGAKPAQSSPIAHDADPTANHTAGQHAGQPAAGQHANFDAGAGGAGSARVRGDAAAAASGSLTKPAADGGQAEAGSPSTASAGAGAAGATGADAGGQSAGRAGTAAISCERCSSYAAPKQTGAVKPSELSALSGLAMSRSQPEILFAHNDHDRPVVYALDLQGQLHARFSLDAAKTSDIEDIAVGPCGTKTCVYLADIGDNAAARSQYSVLRFPEPDVPSAAGDTSLTLSPSSYEQLYFSYEDGSHNAESLMVAPNGNLYIITKLAPGSGGSVAATGPSSVYRLDASAFGQSSSARATKVSSLSIPKSGEAALSAAAAHPCGLGFLARTYDRVYEYLTPAGADFEAAFAATPKIVAMPDEPQSEAIDYRSDGRGFVTSGEGSAAPIMLTGCTPP